MPGPHFGRQHLTALIAWNGLDDPDLIRPGQDIKLKGDQVFVVQKGDTLAKIAARFGLTVMDLKVANGIEDVDLINIGQELVIPSQGVAR